MTDEVGHLFSVAHKVAEGTKVRWEDELSQAAGEEDTTILGKLRELEQITLACRRAGRSFDRGTAGPPGVDSAPDEWRHLVVLNKIGEGSFGVVYRAYDPTLEIDVALKLLPRSSTLPGISDQLLKEARLLARVRHANVVTLYGADWAQDHIGLWMELVEGRTLEDMLKARGPFGIRDAIDVGYDVCRAVAAVHQAGVLHGDIKLPNVMQEAGGRVVLMDFGAGRLLADHQEDATSVACTPAYLAPEILEGKPHSTSSDVYSIGVLLYRLVTGAFPVIGESLRDLRDAHEKGSRRKLRDARPDLPASFAQLVDRATDPDPARRFSTIESLEAGLVRLRKPPPSPSRSPRWVMALAATVLAASAAAWLVLSSDPSSGIRQLDEANAAPAVGAASEPVFDVRAGFFRATATGEQPLGPGDRLSPGDELFLRFQASVPVNLYVIDEDEGGEAFLLFPLRGQGIQNPIPAGEPLTLPGTQRWQVTSAGGREHFLLFVNPGSMESFERAFAELPTPREGATVASAALPASAVEQLRGIGGLTSAPSREAPGPGLAHLFTTPLAAAPERAQGLWVRRLTLENPAP